MPGLVIIGYDGSPDADHAIDFAAARLGPAQARVVTVWESGLATPQAQAAPALGAAAVPSPEDEARLEAAAQEVAAAGAARATAAGLQAEPDTRIGIGPAEIARALFDLAEEHDADLVVVGRRGMGRIRAAVLGSVSDAAIHDGRVPVLVVPVRSEE
jgi:nucleotide-binding universal stress UspA family protein